MSTQTHLTTRSLDSYIDSYTPQHSGRRPVGYCATVCIAQLGLSWVNSVLVYCCLLILGENTWMVLNIRHYIVLRVKEKNEQQQSSLYFPQIDLSKSFRLESAIMQLLLNTVLLSSLVATTLGLQVNII